MLSSDDLSCPSTICHHVYRSLPLDKDTRRGQKVEALLGQCGHGDQIRRIMDGSANERGVGVVRARFW